MKWLVIALLLVGGAYAANSLSEMNVVVFPDVPTTTYAYNFVFSPSTTCDPVLLNVSRSITTNSAGRGNATLDLTTLTATPAFLCTYRTGILVDTQSLNPNAFEAGNVTSLGNGTAGMVPYFINSSIINNTNLFFDATNNRFGLGTFNPLALLHVLGNALFTTVNATAFYQNGHVVLDQSGINASNLTSGIVEHARLPYISNASGWENSTTRIILGNNASNVSIGATPTLFVDNTNVRVGIGTNEPNATLHLLGTGVFTTLNATNIFKNGLFVLTNQSNSIDEDNLNISIAGITGQVLTYNSSGGMNWTTPTLGYSTFNSTESQQADSTGAATFGPLPLENFTLYFSPSTMYFIECVFLQSAAATTTGVQMRFNTTGAPDTFRYSMDYYTSATAQANCQGVNTATNTCAATASSGATVTPARYYGFITTSLNPTVFTVELATEIDTSAARIEQGSFCRVTKRP